MTGATSAAALAAISCALGCAAVAAIRPGGSVLGADSLSPRPRSRLRHALGGIGRSRLGRWISRERLSALSSAARTTWHVDELAGAKVAAMLASTGAVLMAPSSMRLLAFPVGLLAWRFPELLLSRRVHRRLAEASREVPLFLDLLSVASSAGIAPQLAVRLAAEPLDGPLAQELRWSIRRTELGRRWRDEIKDLPARLPLADLRRTAAILGRTEALGSSLAQEVTRLATDVRDERRSRAAERARTAPVKMLFPLVFLILPAFLLLTVVPVLLSTVQSID